MQDVARKQPGGRTCGHFAFRIFSGQSAHGGPTCFNGSGKTKKTTEPLGKHLSKEGFLENNRRFGLLSHTGFWKFLPIFVGGAQFFGGDHFAMMCSVEKLIPKLY